MVGLRMEDSSIVYTVYAVLMVVAGTVLYCCSKIMDEYLAPKHPAHFWIMDYELSFRVACAFGTVSSFLSIMLTLMICLPWCLARHDRSKAREAHIAMSTPSFNPASEIGDGLLFEEELGANPVVMNDDAVTHWGMPNKHEKKPYSWPDTDPYFQSTYLTFPNGTVLSNSNSAFLKQPLDKISSEVKIKSSKNDSSPVLTTFPNGTVLSNPSSSLLKQPLDKIASDFKKKNY